MAPSVNPEYALTIPAAAKRLGLSADSVRRLIRSGRLPSITYPGVRRRFVPPAAVEQFVEAATSTASQDRGAA